MANINLSIDTASKSVSLSVDGVGIPNIEDFHLYTYRDSNGVIDSLDLSFDLYREDTNGLKKRISYYAYASEKAQSAIASEQTVYRDIEGFVGIKEDDVNAVADINSFMSHKIFNSGV